MNLKPISCEMSNTDANKTSPYYRHSVGLTPVAQQQSMDSAMQMECKNIYKGLPQQQVSLPAPSTFVNAASASAIPSLNKSSSCPESPIRRVSSHLRNSAVGLATRFLNKCRAATFTVDGATYTIVASTPENLPKRDELSAIAIGGSETSTQSGISSQIQNTCERGQSGEKQFDQEVASDLSKNPFDVEINQEQSNIAKNNSSNSPSSINGQAARHGSLTIVRRSNSRKSFNQLEYQQQVNTPTSASPATTSSHFIEDFYLLSKSNNTNQTFLSSVLDNRSSHTHLQNLHSTNTTAAQSIKMLPTSPNTSNTSALQTPGSDEKNESEQSLLDDETSSSIGATSKSSVVDLATENLPAVDTPDACDKAALRLRSLLRLMNNGEISAEVLQKNLHYAARVLEAVFLDESKSPTSGRPKLGQKSYSSTECEERLADEDDELSEVQPDAVPPEVREWLASTFTRQLATTRKKTDEKPKFRSVAHAIRAGIFVDRIYRRVSSSALMQFPPEVVKVLKTLDDWSFDVFALAEAANGQPVKYIGYDLLNRYGIIHKFKIAPATLEIFLNRIEEGYCRYRNPYHNNLHAADVTQTVHHMLCQTGLMNWMTDLEIYATLLAALIHDYEHTGTTNNFHVMSGSETALIYNDRAVLENHHISAAFRLLKDDDCNVLSNLSREEYRELRTLIIDMVLSTDMSFHFQQLKNMKNLLTLNEATVDKSKALAMVLHCCDISHPAKRWNLHHRWTMLLLEEFFRQGDLERELGLPFSPLCDRNNTLVAESQIGFIDFIVDPSMSVMADMLEHVLAPIAPMCKNVNASIDACDVPVDGATASSAKGRPTCEAISEGNEKSDEGSTQTNPQSASVTTSSHKAAAAAAFKQKFTIHKPWINCLTANKKIWKEQAIKDAEARATAAALEEAEKHTEEN